MTTKLAKGRLTLQRQAEVGLAPGALGREDEAALDRLWLKTSSLVRGSDLCVHLNPGPHLIIEGWACQTRETRQGRRQILSFLLPGDLTGPLSAEPGVQQASSCRVVALTRLATLPLSAIAAPTFRAAAAAALTDAAHRAGSLSQHWMFNHVERLGGRDAYRAIVHLFLELNERLSRVGLAEGGVFPLPIGRRILAQALGLSLAHTHHVIKRLALDGLLAVEGGSVRLLDAVELARLADFVPAPPRAAPRRGSGGEVQSATEPARPASSGSSPQMRASGAADHRSVVFCV